LEDVSQYYNNYIKIFDNAKNVKIVILYSRYFRLQTDLITERLLLFGGRGLDRHLG